MAKTFIERRWNSAIKNGIDKDLIDFLYKLNVLGKLTYHGYLAQRNVRLTVLETPRMFRRSSSLNTYQGHKMVKAIKPTKARK